MDSEHDLAGSHRLQHLAEKFRDKRYRDGYVAAHTRGVLARQIRNFRGELSQAEFGERIGKRQTVMSRLENPAYGGWSLRTMLEIARKRGVAVFARFVDFPTFLKLSSDMSDLALNPRPYDEEDVDQFAAWESALESFTRWPSCGSLGIASDVFTAWTKRFSSSFQMPRTVPAAKVTNINEPALTGGWTLITMSRAGRGITITTKENAPSLSTVANVSGAYTVTEGIKNV